MAAPEGNQFWKLRSKHGREKLFKSPELLWEAACEYFEWCVANPFMETQAKGSNPVQLVEVPKMRPFTLEGLCLYMDASPAYLRTFRLTLDPKKDETAKGFLSIIDQIEKTIENQQFSGAASGFLNANIIARKLGLKDTTVSITRVGKDLADEEYT